MPKEEKKPQLPARIHPDARKRNDALNGMARQFYGAPESKADISYYSRLLIQCTLPHSDPKTPSWSRKNGSCSVTITSGFDTEGKPVGIPYGSFPRLTLAYIITRVIQTGEPRIKLETHFGQFLKEIGYVGNLRGSTRASRTIQNQMLRLVRATVNFEEGESSRDQGEIEGANLRIASRYAMWWNFKNPAQSSLWGSYIEISDEFLKEILKAPVPLRTDILAELKKSPLALDVYMWLSYRLFAMQESGQNEMSLSYGRLQEQFGTGISKDHYRQFRTELKRQLAKVAELWRLPDGTKQPLHYELSTTRLTLYRSPLIVSVKPPAKSTIERGRILSSRSFDQDTERKARQLAGNWSLEFLTGQYFDWIESAGITPENPAAHFFDFIKSHRERNGNPV
jgi:hypothetical protein